MSDKLDYYGQGPGGHPSEHGQRVNIKSSSQKSGNYLGWGGGSKKQSMGGVRGETGPPRAGGSFDASGA